MEAMNDPGQAAATGVGADGERNIQQGRADRTRLPANLFGRYEYDTTTGDDANVRRWRQMAAGHRKRAMDVRTRASYALNALMDIIYPPVATRPSTYGLDDEARRKYAASLMAHQEIAFQPWEIRRILTAPEKQVAA